MSLTGKHEHVTRTKYDDGRLEQIPSLVHYAHATSMLAMAHNYIDCTHSRTSIYEVLDSIG